MTLLIMKMVQVLWLLIMLHENYITQIKQRFIFYLSLKLMIQNYALSNDESFSL